MSKAALRTFLADRIVAEANKMDMARSNKYFSATEYRMAADRLVEGQTRLELLEEIWEFEFQTLPSMVEVSQYTTRRYLTDHPH